jgi:hypothetical protein
MNAITPPINAEDVNNAMNIASIMASTTERERRWRCIEDVKDTRKNQPLITPVFLICYSSVVTNASYTLSK